MALKDNLKQRRRQLGLTLEEVAKKVGITRQTVQKYESGIVSNIPLERIELLAIALDTTPGFLMGWENDNTADKQVTFPNASLKELLLNDSVNGERFAKLLEAYKNNPAMQKAVDTLLGIEE